MILTICQMNTRFKRRQKLINLIKQNFLLFTSSRIRVRVGNILHATVGEVQVQVVNYFNITKYNKMTY